MEDEIGVGEVITQFIDYELESVNTAIPALVLAIKEDGENLLVDVQPSVSILNRDGSVVAQASILNVPLQQPASSVGGMIFPVAVGDTVLLDFSQRGIDTWKYGSGSPTAPSDYRKFDKKDCVAIPCIFPVSKSMASRSRQGEDYSPGDTVIYNRKGDNPVEIVLKQSGDIVVNAAQGKVTVNCKVSEVNAEDSMTVTTKDFKINCDTYQVSSSSYTIGTGSYSMSATVAAASTGTFSHNGSWILNGIAMETHTHGGVETGSGSTGGPQ